MFTKTKTRYASWDMMADTFGPKTLNKTGVKVIPNKAAVAYRAVTEAAPINQEV